jgi:hypothetical protein
MRRTIPTRFVLTAVLIAVVTPAAAQSIDDRAAQVRQTLAAPPPVETVIDRGTRVLGQPQAAPAASVAPTVDPRLVSGSATPASQSPASASAPAVPAASGMPGLTGTTSPRGTAFVNDPRGTGFLNDSRGTGTAGARTPMPGLRAVPQAGDGQVTGTSNLVTGNGRAAGLAQ